MSTPQRLPPLHVLLIGIICLGWGGNFLASAAALTELPALLFTTLRLALVGLLMLPWLRPPPGGRWGTLAAVALCNGALHFGLSFWALRLAGDISSPAIVMQTYVPLTVLLSVLFLGERIRWKRASAIVVSFAGVLVLGFDPAVLDAPAALVLMLVSALFLAVGTVTMRGLAGMHPFSLQAWGAVIGIPVLAVASLLLEGDPLEHMAAAGWRGWGGIAYSALVASVLCHSLFFVLIQRHPVSQITPFLLIAPLIAIALGVLVWGDTLGPRLILGGSMVLGGVLVIALRNAATSPGRR
ncbi:DMT family transporter [Pseudomarimonas salicorniae]|uniref:DMT family transporter n=1 Tax=Pseudomarimonas salicorniae TaxID=2933270 RepID=A0ABT0GHB6_9GAMM|nr:DMT family transporter [Lysobacter sp. CAU 1642]